MDAIQELIEELQKSITSLQQFADANWPKGRNVGIMEPIYQVNAAIGSAQYALSRAKQAYNQVVLVEIGEAEHYIDHATKNARKVLGAEE